MYSVYRGIKQDPSANKGGQYHRWIKNHGALALWDFECAWFDKPEDVDFSDLINRFNAALKTFDSKCSIYGKVEGFGKVKTKNVSGVSALNATDNFDLKDIPTQSVLCDGVLANGTPCSTYIRESLDRKRGRHWLDDPHQRKSDIADTLLVADILFATIERHLFSNTVKTIVVITGDQDFLKTLRTVRRKDMRILLVIPESPAWTHLLPGLKADFGSNSIWYFNSFMRGGSHA